MERYNNNQNRYRAKPQNNRAIFIPPENSKTGKGRHIVAPVADTLERMRVTRITGLIDRDDYIFPNLAKTATRTFYKPQNREEITQSA